jgi:hypothetical protein
MHASSTLDLRIMEEGIDTVFNNNWCVGIYCGYFASRDFCFLQFGFYGNTKWAREIRERNSPGCQCFYECGGLK